MFSRGERKLSSKIMYNKSICAYIIDIGACNVEVIRANSSKMMRRCDHVDDDMFLCETLPSTGMMDPLL